MILREDETGRRRKGSLSLVAMDEGRTASLWTRRKRHVKTALTLKMGRLMNQAEGRGNGKREVEILWGARVQVKPLIARKNV